MTETLGDVADAVGASAAALSRVDRDNGTARAMTWDRLDRASTLPALARSFALSVTGTYIKGVRPGTIWLQSMVECDEDPALSKFQTRRRFTDLAVIPLGVSDNSVDFIEFHFTDRLGPDQNTLLNLMVSTLCKTWTNRRAGLMSELMLARTETGSHSNLLAPILSMDNPAGLSRAEYRVCLLLARGLSNQRLREELKVKDATLRTHLSNIYAKSQVSGRSELLYQLLSADPFVTTRIRARVA